LGVNLGGLIIPEAFHGVSLLHERENAKRL
jgi:hypothetical protein